jgi:tripartite-type tricarboxylate transporter receptor subunit TctC
MRFFYNRLGCRFVLLLGFYGLASQFVQAAGADYPVRSIRIIAPFSPGGGVDIISRLLANKMSKDLNQEVIVLNRPGATGNIGTEIVAKSDPDGYTLLMGNEATNAISKSIFKDLAYDPVEDFAPISLVARVPEVLVVGPTLAANSVAELIALTKTKPDQLTYGSAGVGSPPHLAGALFALNANVSIRDIPYKGSAPALTDLIGGRIDMYFANILSAMPYIEGEQLRALAVTGAERSRVAPTIPTIAESGLPGYEEYNWYGILAPKGTPVPIIDKLHDEIVKALADETLEQSLKSQGGEIIGSSPAEFAKYLREEARKYADVVRRANISVKN